MIKRIVKLTFPPENVPAFLDIFENSKNKISNFEGCHHLELWREKKEGNVFFTYSFWENEDALNRYRKSELFGSVWPKTKVLFSEQPEAWSVEVLWEA